MSIANAVASKNLKWDGKLLKLLGVGKRATHPRPIQALAPPENGVKASLFHSPRNLSGLKETGSSQYRAAQFTVNHLSGFLELGGAHDYNEVQRCRS